jgi:transposase
VEVPFVLFALVYLLLRRLVQRITGSPNELLETEVEVVVLRHQLRSSSASLADRAFAVAIGCSWPRCAGFSPRGRWSAFVVSPQTLLRWHRELVRRKWTFRRKSTGGRLPISDDVRDLILQMGRENPGWGCIRIRGELAKLGIRVSATKIRTLLRAGGLGPAPRRDGPTWSEFLRSQADAILALDILSRTPRTW